MRWRANFEAWLEQEVMERSLANVIDRNAKLTGWHVLNSLMLRMWHTHMTRLVTIWLENTTFSASAEHVQLSAEQLDLCLKWKDYESGLGLLRVAAGYVHRRPLHRMVMQWRMNIEWYLLQIRQDLSADCVIEVVETNHKSLALRLLDIVLRREAYQRLHRAQHECIVNWLWRREITAAERNASMQHLRAIIRRWDREGLRQRLKGWKLKPMQERMESRKAAAGERTERSSLGTSRRRTARGSPTEIRRRKSVSAVAPATEGQPTPLVVPTLGRKLRRDKRPRAASPGRGREN